MILIILSMFWQRTWIFLISITIIAISACYLRSLYKLNDFRKNLHEGDIVSYQQGNRFHVSEVQTIPAQDLIDIRDLHTNCIRRVGISHIFPI